jgi:hypothetical protein
MKHEGGSTKTTHDHRDRSQFELMVRQKDTIGERPKVPTETIQCAMLHAKKDTTLRYVRRNRAKTLPSQMAAASREAKTSHDRSAESHPGHCPGIPRLSPRSSESPLAGSRA